MPLKLNGKSFVPSPTNYADHLGSPVKATVTVESNKTPVTTQQVVNKEPYGVDPNYKGMQIEVSGGRTINLGNYESARVDICITVPCGPGTLESAYKFATEWVDQKMIETIKDDKG